MSEREQTTPEAVDAAEIPQVQLSETELESVAGGTYLYVSPTLAQACLDAIKQMDEAPTS
ncbi:MAG TPA: hypothetical protein VF746_03500 [Longimicrobium sp.]|jgi:hypothetical protein